MPEKSDRRSLTLKSLADLRSEIERVRAAHQSDTLRALGRRSPQAVLAHLAISVRGSIDGMPALKGAAPLWLRLVGPFVKGRVLSNPLQPGVRMSPTAEAALWDDSMTVDSASELLLQQVDRFERSETSTLAAHPIFDRLSHAEWTVFHLRHSELHLSFLQLT